MKNDKKLKFHIVKWKFQIIKKKKQLIKINGKIYKINWDNLRITFFCLLDWRAKCFLPKMQNECLFSEDTENSRSVQYVFPIFILGFLVLFTLQNFEQWTNLGLHLILRNIFKGKVEDEWFTKYCVIPNTQAQLWIRVGIKLLVYFVISHSPMFWKKIYLSSLFKENLKIFKIQ